MKKSQLFAASALLSVLLIAGVAEAKAPAPATTSAPAVTTEAQAPHGDMHKGMGKMQKLSPEGRKLFADSMKKVHEDNKATFEAMKAKHQEMQDLLKAKTFDKAAYMTKQEEVHALRQKMSAARSEAFAAAAEKMTAEDRAALAGSMMGGMMHKGMRDGMGKGGMGGMGNPDCPMMKDMDAKDKPHAMTGPEHE